MCSSKNNLYCAEPEKCFLWVNTEDVEGYIVRTGQQQEALSLGAYGRSLHLSPLHTSVDSKNSSPEVLLCQ